MSEPLDEAKAKLRRIVDEQFDRMLVEPGHPGPTVRSVTEQFVAEAVTEQMCIGLSASLQSPEGLRKAFPGVARLADLELEARGNDVSDPEEGG